MTRDGWAGPPRAPRPGWYRPGLAAIFLAGLWLSQAIPLLALPEAGYDDGLFVDLARSLLGGRWLGPFDDRTLIKGMFYPLFIAASHVAGLPLKLAEHLAYLGAGLLLSATVGRIVGSRVAALVLFALIAFNPAEWMTGMARAVRDCLSVSLTMALLAAAAQAFLVDPAGAGRRRRAGWLAALGLLLGAFWLTREDREWILPALAVLAGGWATARLGRRRGAAGRSGAALADAALVLLPLAIAAAMVGTVAALNAQAYGVFRDNDLRSRDFQAAIAALRRVAPNEWRHYVVIPRAARAQAYAASPAAAELKPHLEGQMGTVWLGFSCPFWPAALGPCSETMTTWFVYTLRAAVAAAGHYRSAGEADAYYRRLAREIDAACDGGRIACLAPRPSLVLPVDRQDLPDTLAATLEVYRMLVGLRGDRIAIPVSAGAPERMAAFLSLTGGAIEPPPDPGGVRASGWVYSTAGRPMLSIGGLSSPGQATIGTRPAPDVLAAMPGSGATALRFSLSADCGAAPCQLRISRDGAPDLVHSLADPRPGEALRQAGLVLYLDSAGRRAPPAGESHRLRAVQLAVMQAIGRLYAGALPVALPAALLLLAGLVLAALRRRGLGSAHLLAIALLAAVAARIAFLGYFYAILQPVIDPRYLAPAYPPALALIVTVAALAPGLLRRGRPVGPRPGPGPGVS